ncbi:hypothetical protein [Sneathiella sp. P13V-1]|uniref:hypothetical protein n=1 Tax=Sneathiella sp. P13V-1 TaxID=2697366 RepID=UPI001D12E1E5|nr:hypothetical protein [Sneathiella sp. P13V-1]
MNSASYADETEIIRSEVEVYGHVKLLLRVSPEEQFSVKVYEPEEDHCVIDDKKSTAHVAEVLRSTGHLYDEGAGESKFRIDVDYFVGYDKKKHCLISYEVYLTENFEVSGSLVDVVEEIFDYEESRPIVKINGIIHAEERDIDDVFRVEVGSATKELMKAIHDLQKHIAKKALEVK